MHSMRPSCRHRQQGQTAWRPLSNTLKIYDYLLQHGTRVDTANHTRYYIGPIMAKHDVSHDSHKPEVKVKGKGFPYSIPSVGPGADPGVQAVSLQVTVSHPPGGRLPLLSARPAVTSPVAEHHRPLAGTKLYCLVTEAHRCKQLAQGCHAALPRAGFEPATY